MSYQWNGEKPRRGRGTSAEARSGLRATSAGGDCQAEGEKKWNARPDTNRWLAQTQLGDADADIPFRVEGWLAECGTSVWFGAGSTGKTQLMLWMAAMIASRPADRPEPKWLGGEIHGTGHILVLTAEDTREQIMARLRDVVANSLGQDKAARRRTLSRLHIMPFLSMSEDEFDHPNPSLLEVDKEKVWRPTGVMVEIRRYIEEWNRIHVEEDDRIVGVVMDSATSMAGFDSLDAQATTNFFFYLGRLCESLRIFWAVIGHTPKVTSVPLNNTRATAASRLRGVAMWTTAPRMTVEIRLLQEWKTKARIVEENPALRKWLDGRVDLGNILVAYVAKANLKDAWREERYLVRRRRGAFTDVTDMPDELLPEFDREKAEREKDRPTTAPSGGGVTPDDESDGDATATVSRAASGGTARGRPKLDPSTFVPGTQLVFETIRGYCCDGAPGERLSASAIMRLIAEHFPSDPRAALVTSASGGGKRDSRPGSINWHLERIAAVGLAHKIGRFYHVGRSPAGPA